MKSFGIALAGAALLATTSAWAAPADFAKAIANPARPAKAREQDASRKPTEILDFLGLKPGMQTLDVIAGGGYYSQIMARRVGKSGRVIAFEFAPFIQQKDRDAWAPILKAEPNINLMVGSMGQFQFAPATFDFAMIHLNYHDFYWSNEKLKIAPGKPDVYVAALYHGMKPGGVVGVIDHVGRAGDVRMVVDKTHRIDPEVIKADFARAGFVLDGESDLLRNPADNLDMMVFEPTVRGKTDRVVYRFRKPG